jgi:hypothetical protein
MPTDTAHRALRASSPRNQPGFDDTLTRFDALRERIVATPTAAPRPARPHGRRRGVIGLSAAAACAVAIAGVIVLLTAGAAAPQTAYASARKALAATGSSASGTMTLTFRRGTKTWTLETTRWHGRDISLSPGQESVLGPNRRLLLVGGGAYVEHADGTWVHYASEADVGDKLGPAVQLARNNVAGNTAGQILRLATGLERTPQPDGTTLYTGVIPNTSADPAMSPSSDTLLRVITSLRSGDAPGAPGGRHSGLRLRMIVASDGLVHSVSLTFRQEGAGEGGSVSTWSVTYTGLGGTARIAAPAAAKP